MNRLTDLARFMSKVQKTHECWLWTAAVDPKGYGRFWLSGDQKRSMVLAHRWAYEHLVGPIPVGLQIDHLCRVPRCVRPDHLEPVTPQENQRRGIKGALTTHCPQGHSYDEANTLRRSNGHRRCRACHSAREAGRRDSAMGVAS